jgi:hypothetical protein
MDGPEVHRSVRISKQLHRNVDGIELVRLKREQRNQNLCFSSRRFVLCGLTVRRLPADQLLYERRNGKFVLQVTCPWRIRVHAMLVRVFSIPATEFFSTVNASVAVVAASLVMLQLGSANPVVTPFSRAPRFEVSCK